MAKIREGGFLISKINQISARIFNKKLKKYGISDMNTAQGRIIFSLWQNDIIPITELGRKTALKKTTLTSMLERLEQSGHIIRSSDINDKRKIIVSLTKKSRSLKDKYESVSIEMAKLFYKRISEKQIDEFENILRQILSNLLEYEEDNK